ncbi:MAG: oleate hydratase [Coprococcus sp.]
MYYSAGTYEAFARPEKPEGADREISIYRLEPGLAGLSAAFYLVRDGRKVKESVFISMRSWILPGGDCDGRKDGTEKGFYMRGGRRKPGQPF